MKPTDHPADTLRDWLSTYISTMHDEDLDVLTLWTLHTHFVPVLYTTGRLLLDSPVPESGKTTVLDHMARLTLDPIQASSVSSGALIPRLLDNRPRTILIDEADRSLSPDNPNNKDIISTVNSGYRRGGSRPVLVQTADGRWEAKEMSTFGAVAMAGNNPDLAADTRSRTIRVLLMPDTLGTVEDSDWEDIEADAQDLHEYISQWADANADTIRDARPTMPEGVRGRLKECWSPLIRVASLCGPEWQVRATRLAERALELRQAEIDAGLRSDPPRILMLRAMYEHWPEGQERWKTEDIIPMLAAANPALWEEDLIKDRKRVTAQAIGATLGKAFGLLTRQGTTREDRTRAYHRSDFDPVFARMGIAPQLKPVTPFITSTPVTTYTDDVPSVHAKNGVHGLDGGGEGEPGDDPEPKLVWGQNPNTDPDDGVNPIPGDGHDEESAEQATPVYDPPNSRRLLQCWTYLQEHGTGRPREIAEAIGGDFSQRNAAARLSDLLKSGHIHKIATGEFASHRWWEQEQERLAS